MGYWVITRRDLGKSSRDTRARDDILPLQSRFKLGAKTGKQGPFRTDFGQLEIPILPYFP